MVIDPVYRPRKQKNKIFEEKKWFCLNLRLGVIKLIIQFVDSAYSHFSSHFMTIITSLNNWSET